MISMSAIIGIVLLFQPVGFSMDVIGLPCTEVIHKLRAQLNMQVIAEAPVDGGILYTLVESGLFGKKKTALLGCGEDG